MSDEQNGAAEARPPGLVTVMGAALAAGLFAGLLFGIRDALRVVLVEGLSRSERTAPWLASFALYAMFWYAVLGCALMAVVGVGLWVLIRVRRLRLHGPRLVGMSAGVVTFLFVSFALAYLLKLTSAPGMSAKHLPPLLDVLLISFACALGAGGALHAAHARHADVRRLVAVASTVVLVLFVVVFGAVWLHVGPLGDARGTKSVLAHAALLAIGFFLAKGAYSALLFILRSRAAEGGKRVRRRAVMLAVAVAACVGAPLLVRGKQEKRARRTRRAATGRQEKRPNVLWIVMDTFRADALSCYGYRRKTTPCLDRLAEEATLYEKAFSASPWTLPSHASMFTGKLVCQHGTTDEDRDLENEHTTVAEVLAQHGYRTLAHSNNLFASHLNDLDQGFEVMKLVNYGKTRRLDLLIGQARNALHLNDFGARGTNRAVKRWIADAVAAREPFFLFINYIEAHAEHGSTPFRRRWFESSAAYRKVASVSQNPHDYALGRARKTRSGFQTLRTLYDGDVTYLDARIGELLEHLRERDLLDNTLLIITSDHGEEFGESGHLDHSYGVHNVLLHVPLLIRYPPSFKPGARVKHLVELIDIFPTILDVLEIEWEGRKELPGRSLLEPPAPGEVRHTVAERYLPTLGMKWLFDAQDAKGFAFIRRLKCIQNSRYKFVWSSNGAEALYDLSADPMEQENVISELPEEAKQLRKLLADRVGGLKTYVPGVAEPAAQ